jgi:hypothetical protein
MLELTSSLVCALAQEAALCGTQSLILAVKAAFHMQSAFRIAWQ